MEAFWCITIGFVLIRLYWKYSKDSEPRDEYQDPVEELEKPYYISKEFLESEKLERERREAQKQYDKDVAELKKQGYTDEIIAVILPTINNGQ